MIASIYVTFPNLPIAKEISRKLVESRLVACANIIPKMTSIYFWEGEVQEDEEVLVFYKTDLKNSSKVEDALRKLHPFECPCILRSEMDSDSKYQEWIEQVTSAASV